MTTTIKICISPHVAKQGSKGEAMEQFASKLICFKDPNGNMPFALMTTSTAKARINAYLQLQELWADKTGPVDCNGVSIDILELDMKSYNELSVTEKIWKNVTSAIEEATQQENDEKQKKSDIAEAEQKQQREMEIIKSSALGKVPVMESVMELATTTTLKKSVPGTEKKKKVFTSSKCDTPKYDEVLVSIVESSKNASIAREERLKRKQEQMEEHNKRQNLLIEFQIEQARKEDIRRQEACLAQRFYNRRKDTLIARKQDHHINSILDRLLDPTASVLVALR